MSTTTTKELFPIKSKSNNSAKYATSKTPHHTVSKEMTFGFYQPLQREPCLCGSESPCSDPDACPPSPCYEPFGDDSEEDLCPTRREATRNAAEIVRGKMEMIRISEEFKMLDDCFDGELNIFIIDLGNKLLADTEIK